MRIENLRKEYTLDDLSRRRLAKTPLEQFTSWFEEAVAAEIAEPTAMTLATSDEQGRPSARIVLLKGFAEEGFDFYTNYSSRKGRELAANPQAALLFFWQPLQRQVRIGGRVSKLPRELSDQYFASRPRGSRLSAVASPQSEEVESRGVLERIVETLDQDHQEREIRRPEGWGGYRLRATEIEFWQGRASRLHDRFRYRLEADGGWSIARLAP
ncbi:MAG: pyridoxamine 5'-phosphate oxidase [Acidobacteriota bacterium]